MGAAELIDSLFPDIPALRGARALCVSHVYPTTGVRLPLRLLREKADELKIRYISVPNVESPGQTSENLYALRVSTAYFNTSGQIEMFSNALKEVLMHIN